MQGLVKRYDGRDVVAGLDLVADAGAVTAVLGPNGAGKTTTVECCEGLRTPDGGTVRVLGLDPVADARALRPRVGVMLQDGGLPTGARAGEVLRHVAAMYAAPRDLGELGERLGIGSFARTTVRRLSGGQRQRLSLAAAVVGRPEVVFLDEPSAGMDPQSRHAVWDLVRELRDEGAAVVLTTHLMDEAEDLADRVHVVDHGRVIASGSVPDLLFPDAQDDRTLRFDAAAGLDVTAVAAALDAATPGTTGAWLVTEPQRGSYVGTGPAGPRALAALTAWLADHDVLASRLTVGRRTLEDVFLDLTGRHLR
nr:ABC transporter ATP-binding protein [Krasilnikoviella flava]